MSRAAPLPRFGIVLDDVTDLSRLRLAPTWATETSSGNFQVGYTCTTILSPADAARLGTGAALVERTDPSGSDGYARTSRAALMQQTGKSREMLRLYLTDLRTTGMIETRTEPRALAVRVSMHRNPSPPR